MIIREFIATVTPRQGGTETVTVQARSVAEAVRKLVQLGYRNVRNVA